MTEEEIRNTLNEVFSRNQLIDELESSTSPFIDEQIETLKEELISKLIKSTKK